MRSMSISLIFAFMKNNNLSSFIDNSIEREATSSEKKKVLGVNIVNKFLNNTQLIKYFLQIAF